MPRGIDDGETPPDSDSEGGFSTLFSVAIVIGVGDSLGWSPLMARLSLRRSVNTADFGRGIGVPPAGDG